MPQVAASWAAVYFVAIQSPVIHCRARQCCPVGKCWRGFGSFIGTCPLEAGSWGVWVLVWGSNDGLQGPSLWNFNLKAGIANGIEYRCHFIYLWYVSMIFSHILCNVWCDEYSLICLISYKRVCLYSITWYWYFPHMATTNFNFLWHRRSLRRVVSTCWDLEAKMCQDSQMPKITWGWAVWTEQSRDLQLLLLFDS